MIRTSGRSHPLKKSSNSRSLEERTDALSDNSIGKGGGGKGNIKKKKKNL